jgi:hypothetical protein
MEWGRSLLYVFMILDDCIMKTAILSHCSIPIFGEANAKDNLIKKYRLALKAHQLYYTETKILTPPPDFDFHETG